MLVGGALGGAAWLFVADGSSDRPAETASTEQTRTDTGAGAEEDGVLSVPKDDGAADATNDSRRRDEGGRERVDPEAVVKGGDGAKDGPPDAGDDATAADPSLPAVFASLKDRSVVLTPASATIGGTGDPARLVAVGGLRVPCGQPADTTRLAVELALLSRVEDLLRRAGANVRRLDDAKAHTVPCVDARVASQAKADYVLVVRADLDGVPQVYAGRPAKGATTAQVSGSIPLAAELAGALGIKAVTPARTTAQQRQLERAGAIDLPGGAAVALAQVDASGSTDAANLDATAMQLARAIAATASRAGGPG